MRVCLLASGSKGNAIYVESRQSRVLIDAGLSGRQIRARLSGIGVCGEDLNAILVTHEHGDHIRGLGPLARQFDMPVHLHHRVMDVLSDVGRLPRVEEFDGGTDFLLRDIQVHCFPITHDAVAPVGFTIDTNEGKIGIATDLGISTRLVADCLKGCRVLILESNHDEDMLRDGPYPWHLKQRVRSHHGHLSNNASAQLLRDLLWEGLEAVFLAHLSETNNRADLAEASARAVLQEQNICQPQLIIGTQHQASICFHI